MSDSPNAIPDSDAHLQSMDRDGADAESDGWSFGIEPSPDGAQAPSWSLQLLVRRLVVPRSISADRDSLRCCSTLVFRFVSGISQRLTRQGSGVVTILHKDLAVDNTPCVSLSALHEPTGSSWKVVNKFGERKAHSLKVKHSDVGFGSWCETPTTRHTKELSRHACQLTHTLTDTAQTSITHPVREEPGRLAGVHDLSHMGTRIGQPKNSEGAGEHVVNCSNVIIQERP